MDAPVGDAPPRARAAEVPPAAPAIPAAPAVADAPRAAEVPEVPAVPAAPEAAIEAGPDIARLKFHRHRAYIVGIDAYEHVSPLTTAVADASRLAEVLGQQHHFLVNPPLLDASGAQLRTLLQAMTTEVQADDRVLFYFAGHGVAADGDDGPAGYIVPADAQPGDLSTFLPMGDLQAVLDALPCRHLLLVLDCCFSGAFKWSSRHRAITGLMPKRLYAERFDRFVKDAARQVITSAAYDQKALDVLDGRPTGARGAEVAASGRAHSPFANALFDALAGQADVTGEREGDGVLTATEIYAYIRDRIEPATLKAGERLRQTPSFFPLKGHDKGEFVFLHPRHRLNLPPMPLHSPYKGLASFDEADAHLFYGRDRVIAELHAKVADAANRLLVVVGPSGTGKSSVIKAGLLPRLRAQGLPILPVMRPGAQPMAALDAALQAATAAARQAAGNAPTGGGAVLLIDQYEELVTRCADPEQRAAFDRRLADLLTSGTPLARVIVTVRSDFEPQFSGGALKQAWARGRCTVPPFSLDELREVIVMPTVQEVLIFDPPELVDQIIGEVVQSPGALPLLSYALNELYEAYVRSGRSDRALKQDDYEALGGVMGALRNKADRLVASLASDAERGTLRRIMLRMVSVEGELAGRRVPMADLDFVQADAAAVAKVVEQLVDSRLVVRNAEAIEPAHDALVRAWRTLRDWIHEAGKDKLILGTQLATAVQSYEGSRDADYLWHASPNLPVVQSLLKGAPHCWFNRREAAFIQASVRRKTRRLRIGVASAAAVFAVVTALMVWGWVEQRRAVGTIAAARGFSDELMFKVVDKLRAVDKTQEARTELVRQVAQLSSTLSVVGAGQDPSTQFWLHVLHGDFAKENQQLDRARQEYEAAMAVAAPRAESDPNWARNLSVAYGMLGDLARSAEPAAADFAAAREWYRKALAIDQRLAALAPDNRLLQQDLHVSHTRLGQLERSDSDGREKESLLAARAAFDQAHGVALRLAQSQPDDAQARSLAVTSRIHLGFVAYGLADDAQDAEALRAVEHLEAALAAAQGLPPSVRSGADLQYDLCLSHARLAELHLGNDRLAQAREAARATLAIAQRHIEAQPDNREWQSVHLVGHSTLGDIERRAGDADAARAADEAVAAAAARVGAMALKGGDLGVARAAYEAAATAADRVAEALPAQPKWLRYGDEMAGRIDLVSELARLKDRHPPASAAAARPPAPTGPR